MDISFNYSGKNVLVTGAGTGMGREMALKFAQAGANVVIADYNPEAGKKTAADCAEFGVRTAFYQVDVSNENAVREMAQKVLAEFDIDFLISNAGIGYDKMGPPFTNIPVSEFRRTLDINTVGFINMVQAFYDHFTSRRQGKIVCTASLAVWIAGAKMPQYAASKAALYSLVKSVANDLGPYNINVNSIAPGFVPTPIYVHAIDLKEARPGAFDDCETSEDVVRKMGANSPLKRAQTVEDMAYPVLFLCSEVARNITGVCLPIDSGRMVLG